MALETVPKIKLQYYLINYDSAGNERYEDDGSNTSQIVLDVLDREPITDVFIFSHGWQSGIPEAQSQYSRWIKAMAANTADRDKIKQLRPGFNPLLIGLHWPSLPWGNENIQASSEEEAVGYLADHYADQIADSEESKVTSKGALKIIFSEALGDMEPDELSEATLEAYETLNNESHLGSDGTAGAPGDDREPFDPESIYEESEAETEEFGEANYGFWDGGGFILSRIFSPLRALSYWKMKARARKFGEKAGFGLLNKLQQTASEQARFHLVGHSFGCIVMSATLGGPKAQGVLPRPVNSLTLIQGAVSMWAYCADIPKDKGYTGYFYPVIRDGKVAGPILTTISEHDTAVGLLYPLASGLSMNTIDFSGLPKYGAIGAFGIQGDGIPVNRLNMLSCDEEYTFESGQIYNLESSRYIWKRPKEAGIAGAHGEFDAPEVAHAVWSAAMVS